MSSSHVTTYAVVGLGGRSGIYLEAISEKYKDAHRIVALCDRNAGRLALAASRPGFAEFPPRQYSDTEFEKMIADCRPDFVIVVCPDSFHDDYICRAMELGCDVITEKPMTIDAARTRRILETRERTGRHVRVAFNYRYSPTRAQVKSLLMSGVIGDVLSVDFHWMLDTYHGADYFRRWHREKKNSGGLLVHKSTHHFDLVNWWLSAIPTQVAATGHRRFATPETGDRLGLIRRATRCLDCPEKGRCSFLLDLPSVEELNTVYLQNESYDGYYRDRCIFGPGIDIEDSMQVIVNYDTGATLSYSLNVFCAWEGYTIQFNGTKGRLEHKCEENVYINGDGTIPGALKKEGTYIRIYPIREAAYDVPIRTGTGGHGGGDDAMLADLLGEKTADPYRRAADHRSGALSILCGIAANQSIASGQWVTISDLARVAAPDYPAMPDRTSPLEIPPSA